jgi:type I restriction enzyme S subunit
MMGELPNGWSLAPLGEVASDEANSFVDGPFGSDLKVSDYTEAGVRILQLQNLGDGDFVNKNKIYTSEAKARLIARCITRPGDIIIAKMAEPLARAVVVPPVEGKFLIVADLMKLRVSANNDPIFVKNAINAPVFRREAERLSTGTTRTRISLSVLKKIGFPTPPFQEQRKIAKILSTVDNLIEKTQTLIDKYQSIKQGMMHDLFTRGVDENGHLRPSYEEAPHLYMESELGWIPREWEVCSISALGEVVTGNTPSIADENNYGGRYMFVTPADITSDSHFVESTLRGLSEKGGSVSRIVPKESISTVCIGSTIGKMSILCSECATNQQINTLVPENMSKSKLYYYLMEQYLIRQLRVEAGLQAVPIVNKSTFSKMKIPVPGKQKELDCINQRIDWNDRYLEKERHHLAKLKKIKAGLMQDLLTGRVRVKVDA